MSAARRRAEAVLAAQAREIRDLRGAIEALSATVQAVRDDVQRELTAAPRLSKEVDALEERLDALESAARTTIPRAMTRAVDRRLERRLADLLGHIEGRLQEIVANPRSQPGDGAPSLAPPANGARRRRSSRRA